MQCKINSYCYVQGGRYRNKYIVHWISRYSKYARKPNTTDICQT